jgi:ribonuclease J
MPVNNWRDKVVSLTVYDGAMGIGGNKLHLEEGGKGVFLEFGKNFGKYGVFYEELLNTETLKASTT